VRRQGRKSVMIRNEKDAGGVSMTSECESCGESREKGESVEITGRSYWLCDDCCRKLRGIIEGSWL
jgi:hypothetical protein